MQRGSKVKEGELLATLENSDLAAAAMDNKGFYMAAEASFATATKAQVPEDTLKAESDVAQTKANLDLNPSIVKSRKQLFAEGAIPGRDLDTAQASLVQAQAAYDCRGEASGVGEECEPRGGAEVSAGAVDVSGGEVQRCSGANELLRDSQPNQRRGDRPAIICR